MLLCDVIFFPTLDYVVNLPQNDQTHQFVRLFKNHKIEIPHTGNHPNSQGVWIVVPIPKIFSKSETLSPSLLFLFLPRWKVVTLSSLFLTLPLVF